MMLARVRNSAIAAIVLCVFLMGASGSDTPESSAVESGEFVTTIRVTGKVVPMEGAMFVQAARVSGRLLEILKHEGENVVAGTPIFKISSAECASLSEESRVAHERNLGDMTKAVERREKRLDLRLDGDDCLVLASNSGTITRRFIELGSNFNAGDPLAHVVDTHRLTVELDVPEKDSSRVSVGKKVTVRLASEPGVEFKTKILNVVPALDPNTRTTKAKVVPFHFPHAVSIEAFVVADVEVASPERTLIVPGAALVFYQNRQWVLKISTGVKPQPVPVEVLNETEEKSSVRPAAGFALNPGDRVMTRGAVFAFKHLRSEMN